MKTLLIIAVILVVILAVVCTGLIVFPPKDIDEFDKLGPQ